MITPLAQQFLRRGWKKVIPPARGARRWDHLEAKKTRRQEAEKAPLRYILDFLTSSGISAKGPEPILGFSTSSIRPSHQHQKLEGRTGGSLTSAPPPPFSASRLPVIAPKHEKPRSSARAFFRPSRLLGFSTS